MSHEKIRQEVLKIEPKEIEMTEEEPKKVDALFLEVDGLFVPKQQSTRKNREVKIGIAHEGWDKRHPSSEEYELVNKSYWKTLENGETFWESFSRYLYTKYDITEDTHVVINGDGAPWIRAGVDYFPSAVYTYDRYHLKKWIQQALSNREKQERRKAYLAADDNDPVALVAAIAEAEKAEIDEKKKEDISELRLFILDNLGAFRDYREVLKEKGADVSEMRPMGATESNMNLFSRRLKKMGYSWSPKGLKGMVSAMTHWFEGTLSEIVQSAIKGTEMNKEPVEYPSFATLLTQKTKQSVGAIQGQMPAINSSDQGKPYVKALKGLAGLT
jgi:hypothetical protein